MIDTGKTVKNNYAKLSVLIIDDDDLTRRIAEQILRDMGFQDVHATGLPEEGLALILEGQNIENGFDLVICDWMMPNLTGIEILRHVRATKLHTPFIMLTSKVTKEAVQEASELDVSAYLAKPFTVDQVQRKVKAALLGAR